MRLSAPTLHSLALNSSAFSRTFYHMLICAFFTPPRPQVVGILIYFLWNIDYFLWNIIYEIWQWEPRSPRFSWTVLNNYCHWHLVFIISPYSFLPLYNLLDSTKVNINFCFLPLLKALGFAHLPHLLFTSSPLLLMFIYIYRERERERYLLVLFKIWSEKNNKIKLFYSSSLNCFVCLRRKVNLFT
jgi:hypothetical protein